MRKVDRHREFQRLAGPGLVDGFAIFHPHGPPNVEIFHRSGLLGNPGLLQGFDERHRASVEHRRFRGVHFDIEVVDLESGHGRQHVLDRVQRALAITELRSPFGEYGELHQRGRLRRVGQVDAPEADPGAWISAAKGQPARVTEMQSYALQRYRLRDRAPHVRGSRGRSALPDGASATAA